jgi:RimJ/RimL family protein N-acetyltransferase
MRFNLQPTLQNDRVSIRPLRDDDFEALYAVASDPLVWEQHPNKDRYKREVFQKFFEGAMKSGGAFLIFDANTNEPIGSSRYYDLDEEKNHVLIGYTFFARRCWGKGYNPALKDLMLRHAFQYVDKVLFHIGAVNARSQIAMEKIGGRKIGEEDVSYYAEDRKLNYVYEIRKEEWTSK